MQIRKEVKWHVTVNDEAGEWPTFNPTCTEMTARATAISFAVYENSKGELFATGIIATGYRIKKDGTQGAQLGNGNYVSPHEEWVKILVNEAMIEVEEMRRKSGRAS